MPTLPMVRSLALPPTKHNNVENCLTMSSPRPGVSTWAVVAAGGALGALLRYGLVESLPSQVGAIWATNALGCFLMGALMATLAQSPTTRYRLTRPFLGVGVLGGFTTFSTYATDVVGLFQGGDGGAALVVSLGTMAAALVSVTLGHMLTASLLPRGEET